MECAYLLHIYFTLISEFLIREASGAKLEEHEGMKLCICTFIELIRQSFMYNNNKNHKTIHFCLFAGY